MQKVRGPLTSDANSKSGSPGGAAVCEMHTHYDEVGAMIDVRDEGFVLGADRLPIDAVQTGIAKVVAHLGHRQR